jgi:hypothetical protein
VGANIVFELQHYLIPAHQPSTGHSSYRGKGMLFQKGSVSVLCSGPPVSINIIS